MMKANLSYLFDNLEEKQYYFFDFEHTKLISFKDNYKSYVDNLNGFNLPIAVLPFTELLTESKIASLIYWFAKDHIHIKGLGIRKIEASTSYYILDIPLFGFENKSLPDLKDYQRQIADAFKIDSIVLEEASNLLFKPEFSFFDMDSTLIQVEVIVELSKALGLQNKVQEITESAMRGEIDFKESLSRRLKLIEGTPESVLSEIASDLPLSPGALILANRLHHIKCFNTIVSGGFTYFANHIKSLLNFDKAVANVLEFENGKLIGEAKGEVVDAEVKESLVKEAVQKTNKSTVLVVGDGANDLLMMNIVTYSVAYKAKEVVKKQARYAINHNGLDVICAWFNF